MRILFALPGFHRYDRGAEVALLSVAQELAYSGHSVCVMGSGEERNGVSYDFVHIPSVCRERLERLPRMAPFRSETSWEDATFAVGLLQAYRPAAFDCAVTCSFPFTHWALRRPAKKKPVQVFVTQNGDWPAWSNDAEFRTFWCDGLVCTNPDYLDRNQEQWNCELIPNGIDLERFSPVAPEPARFGLPLDKSIVLMVSALIDSKRVVDGINAVASIEDAVLVVAGDGPLREEVERHAARLLPGRFFRLNLPSSEMPSLYSSADVFLHLSLLESFGNVFLEARACGLPIVGHDTPRLRWILEKGRDFLCDTSDHATLVTFLREALAFGRAAKQPPDVKKFAWRQIAQQYLVFFQKLRQPQADSQSEVTRRKVVASSDSQGSRRP